MLTFNNIAMIQIIFFPTREPLSIPMLRATNSNMFRFNNLRQMLQRIKYLTHIEAHLIFDLFLSHQLRFLHHLNPSFLKLTFEKEIF